MSNGHHHDERINVIIPEFIKVEIGLDAQTRALANRILDRLDRDDAAVQQKVDALTKRLADSRNKLVSAIVANPDPNPND